MKSKGIVIGLIVVVIVGLLIYFFVSPKGPATTGNSVPTGPAASSGVTGLPAAPMTVTGTIPATSYGKDSVGTPTTTEVTASNPVPVTELGILQGTVKPMAGTNPQFASIRLGLYDPKTQKELASTTLTAEHSYRFIVNPGEYVLNIVAGTGKSDQLPQRLYLGAGQTTNLNFFVR